jgi:hypothetical protein
VHFLSAWQERWAEHRLGATLMSCRTAGSTIALAGLLLASMMRLAAGAYNPFIYFRF